MEYLDVYDEFKNKTGKIIPRTKDKPDLGPNEHIRVIIIFIQNSEGKLLIQMTSKEKGSEWATTGGFIKSGDTSYDTAIIEVKEELGIDISKDNIELIGDFRKGLVIFDVYYLKKNINIEDLIYQKEEVEYVKWLSFDEIENLIKTSNFRQSSVVGLDMLKDYLNNTH